MTGVCVCVRVCSRAWLSTLFDTAELGWLGLRLGSGCSGDFGWGSAIAPSYRFPHEGLPYHPCPERSPFFSHPRDTRYSPSPAPPTHSLPSPPPPPPPPPSNPPSPHLSPPFISTQLSVVQHSTVGGRGLGWGGGASKIFSLSKKHTHT